MGRTSFLHLHDDQEGQPLDDGDEDYETWRDYLSNVAGHGISPHTHTHTSVNADIPSLKPRKLAVMTDEELAAVEKKSGPETSDLEQVQE